MLAKLYRALPPGGIWFLASAALFLVGALAVPGSGDGRMSTIGVVGALTAVLVVVAFSDRRPKHRP